MKNLDKVTQNWITSVIREACRDAMSGDILSVPDMPDSFVRVSKKHITEAFCQGFWIQYLYMREIRCIHGVEPKYRGPVTLADKGKGDNAEEIRAKLEKIISESTIVNSSTWADVLPEDSIDWLNSYTPSLAGVLDRDVLKSVRGTIQETLREGATVSQRIEALKAAHPDIAKMAHNRVAAIARTEVTRADNMGRLSAMRGDPDILGVEFSAIMDDRTTAICNARHGLKMRIDDPKLPTNTPPLHVNCRSLLLPVDVYEYPDGIETDEAFSAEDLPPSTQRPEDIEAVSAVTSELEYARLDSEAEDTTQPDVERPPLTREEEIIEETKAFFAKREQDVDYRVPYVVPNGETVEELNKIAVDYGIAYSADFTDLGVRTGNNIIQAIADMRREFPDVPRLEYLGVNDTKQDSVIVNHWISKYLHEHNSRTIELSKTIKSDVERERFLKENLDDIKDKKTFEKYLSKIKAKVLRMERAMAHYYPDLNCIEFNKKKEYNKDENGCYFKATRRIQSDLKNKGDRVSEFGVEGKLKSQSFEDWIKIITYHEGGHWLDFAGGTRENVSDDVRKLFDDFEKEKRSRDFKKKRVKQKKDAGHAISEYSASDLCELRAEAFAGVKMLPEERRTSEMKLVYDDFVNKLKSQLSFLLKQKKN